MTTFTAITTAQIDAESYVDTTLAGQWSNNILAVVEGDASASAARIAGNLAMTAILAGTAYLFHSSVLGVAGSQLSGAYSPEAVNSPEANSQHIIQRAGTYRCQWEYTSNGSDTTFTRIYKNGAGVGAVKSKTTNAYSTETDDLTFAAGDLIDIYGHSAGTLCYIKNFKIMGTVPPFG